MKVFEAKTFGGINRDVSTEDRNVIVADVARNVRLNPQGVLVKRDGYSKVFSTCPLTFDHTTPSANRLVRNNIVNADDTEVYNSHRRKTVVVGTNGGTTYIFSGIIGQD